MSKRILKILLTLTAVIFTAFAVFALYGCNFASSGQKPPSSSGTEQNPPSDGDDGDNDNEQNPPSDDGNGDNDNEQNPPSDGDDGDNDNEQNPPSDGDDDGDDDDDDDNEQNPPSDGDDDGDDEPEQPVYYTVTFDCGDGSSVPAQYVVKDGKAVAPEAPERNGYIFEGWYTSGNVKYSFETAVTSDFTLTAKWAVNDSVLYTVTFVTNAEGTALPAQEVIKGGNAVQPQVPDCAGRRIEGWYIDRRLSVKYDFTAEVTEDITLYAKWVDSPVYCTVTFESNGGNDLPVQLVEHGKTVAEPKTPVKTNYIFKGWFTDQEFESLYDFTAEVTGDITLYAKWAENAEPPVEPVDPVEPEQPEFDWSATQADFTADGLSDYFDGSHKSPSEITAGAFTFGKNLYFENSNAGLKLENGNINTQNQAKAITFELNGAQNTLSFQAKGASSGTLKLYKVTDNGDELVASWACGSNVITVSRGDLELEAGTYYLGSNDGSVRLGALIIYEYLPKE